MTAPLTPEALLAALPHAVLRPATPGRPTALLSDVSHDSRDAGPGVLFAARPGARADGHDFAAAAVAAGSPALLVERELRQLDVPQIVVPSVAEALGTAAAAVHGHPTRQISVLGVTGTNGKTTTAYLLDAIWQADGRVTGVVGTVETRIAGVAVPGVRTTPEASDLQRLFGRMRDAGVSAASIEVSSHGLALGRLTGTRFAAVLFSNLSQDHLDFHDSMEDYFLAKASLFTPRYTRRAVVTVDDRWGRRLAAMASEAGLDVWTLSRDPFSGADVTATEVRATAAGASFTAQVRGQQAEVHMGLPGDYNVTNALGAIATACQADVALDVAARGVATLAGVPGRMQRVDAGQPFTVLVDYAHTPDSVATVLAAAQAVTRGRVLVVLGCGGDRDHAKRPLMAEAAAAGADRVWFTSDNPRSEDPEAIIDEMMAGVAAPRAVVRIVDREAAIRAAIADAEAGDTVVIAGKGHETYQEFADGRRIHFDDREVARAALTGEVA